MARTVTRHERAIVGVTAAACVAACNLIVSVPDSSDSQTGEGGAPPGPPLLDGAPAGDGTGVGTGAVDSAGVAEAAAETGGHDDASVADGGAETGTPAEAGNLPPSTIIAPGRRFPIALAVDPINDAVYWTEASGGVFEVPKGGGPVVTLKEPDDGGGSAGRIATDSTNVYWADAAHGAIAYVSVLGGTPSVLATSPSPSAVATDGAYVYWSDLADNAIFRAAISAPHPSAPPPIVGSDDALSVLGLATAAGWLVWGEENRYAYRLALSPDGGISGPPIAFFNGIAQLNDARFLVADDLGIYWTAGSSVTTQYYGSVFQSVAWTEDAPSALAVAATHDIYWVDDGATNAVRREVRLDAGTWSYPPETVARASSPTAIGLDAQAVYWANGTASGSIAKLRFADIP